MSRGDYSAVRSALTALANYPYLDSVPGAWLPRVRALQDEAGAVAKRENSAELALGVANVARACGDCHAATGGGVPVSIVERDRANGPDSLPDRMFRHERAATEMWFGLVAPSDAAWNAGAKSLATASLQVEIHGDPPPRFRQALQNVRFLGATAERTKNPADRARVYANLLRSCADCHRTPVGPLR